MRVCHFTGMESLQLLFFCVLLSFAISKLKVPRWTDWYQTEEDSCYSPNCTDPEEVPYRFRFRWCIMKSRGKRMCQGPHLEAVACFHATNCPVDGQWSDWGEWKCDFAKDTATRERECNNPPPKNGGKNCNPADAVQQLEKEVDEKQYSKICKRRFDFEGSGSGSGENDDWDDEGNQADGEEEDPWD